MKILLAVLFLIACSSRWEGEGPDVDPSGEPMPGGKGDDGHVFFSPQLDEDSRARITGDLALIAELGARYASTLPQSLAPASRIPISAGSSHRSSDPRCILLA